jgi:RNA polymerase sigma-70 factor (ECF subfamily)
MDPLTRDLLAARDGDRLALVAAIRTAQPEVWRMASHLVGPDAADDVTQDVFVRAWRALPAYRGDASGRTWLLSIARRACADAVRHLTRRRRLAKRLGRSGPRVSPAADATSEWAVTELVDSIDVARREAFVLTQVVGCSYAEAAEIVGVPVGTIRSRVARAREDLLTLLRAAEAG